MSESEIAWRAGVGAEGMEIPASEACASASALAPAAVTASAGDSLSLLKWVVSFPAMLGTMRVGAVFIVGRMFAVARDLWWHVKTGQNILATHRWPTTDPYSFTVAGTPWMAYEWLGDVLFGAVGRLAGLRGLVALLIILGSAVMLALYAYASLRSRNSKGGFVARALLYVLATPSFSLRPQMLGDLFIVLTLMALERFHQDRPRALWFLPALFLIWINTHGSWVIGLGVIAVFLVSGLMESRIGGIESHRWSPAQRVRFDFIFLISLRTIPFTPYGLRMAAYPFTVASSLPINVANVLEWQPMPFNYICHVDRKRGRYGERIGGHAQAVRRERNGAQANEKNKFKPHALGRTPAVRLDPADTRLHESTH